MRTVHTVLSAVALAAAACSILFAVGAEPPPSTNPAHLREIVRATRAPLRDGIRVTYRYWTSEMPGDAPGTLETIAWNERGVRTEIGGDAVEVSTFDRETGLATRLYSDGVVEQSADPDLVGFGVAGLQCEYVLGMYPTRDVAGRTGFTNDLMHSLAHANAVIQPEMAPMDGQECVVVDIVRRGADGGQRTVSRGYYAPGLGYAQVALEFFAPSGCMVSSWHSSNFIAPVPGAVAIPTRGEFRNLECGGDVVSWVVVEMDRDAAGMPAVAVGARASTDLQVPPGARIRNLDVDTAEPMADAVAAPLATAPAVTAAALAVPSSGFPVWLWALAGGCAALAIGLVAGWRARRPASHPS
jgi:hypothetical protein